MSWLRLNIRRPLSLLFVGMLFLAYSTNAQAPLDVRVALVIGNAAYKNIPALANATNDAKSMSSVLRKLGFNVIEVVDGDKAQMVKAIAQMQTLLQGKQAVGMLYYAGHGLQLDWRNYMVPVDAKLSQASDIATQTVDIENVIDTMKRSATRMNIIVLDACRDNPFSGKASGKGLAQLDAPPGTYLAFATSPGNVAEDGDESASNGLFTHYLLKELQRPARIEDLFKRVRLQVRQKSQGRQIPWDSSSLEDDFAFNDGVKHTFNPEDLIKEAQLAKEAQAQFQRAAHAAAEREKQIAQQIALEQQQLAEAQKIQNQNARLQAESEAKEREKQLTLAAAQERQKAQAAALALERARAEEAQRIKDIELAKAQAAEQTRRNTLSREEAQAQQFAQEKSAWDKIKDTRNKADVYAFILQFPNGMLSELANTQLELLDKAQIKPQADKQGRIQEFAQRRYTQGETFEFIGKDGYTGLPKWNQSFTVLSVDDEGAEVQGTRTGGGTWKQRVSHAGLQSGDNSGKYDPPITFMPAGIVQVGYKWRARTNFTNARNNAQEWLEVAAKVVARETIEVPAGKFDTFKIEVAMQYQSGHRTQLTIWTDPAIGAGIRIKSESRPPRGSADITIRELTSIKRGS
jgi:chemotaxis protein histidine kinase CheA